MQQLRLFEGCIGSTKKICFDNIKATFVNLEGIQELLLEINSNKFLINFKTSMNRIEEMEIVAVKWFVELSLWVLRTIKKIVTKLYFEA